MSTSIRFSINSEIYRRMIAWQQEINHSILRHQIETRGQALVSRLGEAVGVQKVYTLPEPGQAEPFFGAFGGAYRYTFHPIVDACELEVLNLMGGFAFYYPERFDPLRMFLFEPPALIQSDEETFDLILDAELDNLYQHDAQAGAMHFRIPPLLYQTFSKWPWSRRPLHAYDFVFVPNASGCDIQVRSRESGVHLDLMKETALL